MTNLKPCPFCGGTDIDIPDGGGSYYVTCNNCTAELGRTPEHVSDDHKFASKEDAETAWNTRSEPPVEGFEL